MVYLFRNPPPMDYGASDTQGHKLQLAGEARSKSSSVLRPYAFPRFDFDDSLQGHLRFDSLVETEVFPGIQSREDEWIEDFSRGSTINEFSSSVAESCSITRPDNVWSEATSSESVEMLLKSVGQEQIVPKETVTENSNSCNELGYLTTRMEPVFEQDNLTGECTRISDTTMPQDNELLNNCSGLENHVEEKSQGEEMSVSQPDLVQKHGSSSVTCPGVLEEEWKAPVHEGDLLLDTECDGKAQHGVECPVHQSVARAGECLSHIVVPYENIVSSSRSLGPSQITDEPSTHGVEGTIDLSKVASDAMKEQLASEEMADAGTHLMEQHKIEDTLHTEDVPRSFGLNAICVNKGTFVGVSCATLCTEGTQILFGVRDDDIPLTSPTLLGKGQTNIESTSRAMTAGLTGNDFETDNSELHATKLDNFVAEDHCNAEPKMDSVLQSDNKLSSDKVDSVNAYSHKKGGQGDDVTGSLSESSLIKGEGDHSIDNVNNANIADVSESMGFPKLSSLVDLTKDTVGDGSIKDLHDASTVSVEDSSSLNGSGEDFEERVELKLSNTYRNEDISVEVKREENIKLRSDVIDTSSETCVVLTSNDRVGSSAMMKNTSHDETILNQPQPESESKMDSEIKLDPVIKDNNEETHSELFGREPSHADEKEESGARMSINSSSSISNESKQVAPEVDSACNANFGTHYESTASELSDKDGKLIAVAETCNNTSERESLKENPVDCSKGLEVQPVCDDSPLNKGNVMEGYLSAADPLKVACDSPTNISSTAIIPDEGKQEVVGGSELVESKVSTPEDLKSKETLEDNNSFTFKVNSLPDVGREKTNNWTPFPIAEPYKSAVVSEGATTPDVDKLQARSLPENSGHNAGEHANGMSKNTSGRKRRVSGKGAAKENSHKGFNVKKTTPTKSPRKSEKSCMVALSHGSSLPALKSSASLLTAFQQPFTDLQQVQLRAQIFVYGSIIQRTVPDEACMVSAFGSSDSGRGEWEPIWKAAVERVRSIKSHPSGESPLNSHSTGAKVPVVAGNQVSPQSKVVMSPLSPDGSRTTATTILNPMIPRSSPGWSFSAPYHDGSQSSSLQRSPVLDNQPIVSSLHPYQTRPIQSIISHTIWPSQAPVSSSPWALQNFGLNVNSHFPTKPMAEMAKLTSVKDFPLPMSSGLKITSTPFIPPVSPSTVLAVSSHLNEQTKGTLSQELPSAEPKPRRRKKAQASNGIPQSPLLSQAQTETVVASSSSSSTQTVPVTIPSSHVTAYSADVLPTCSIPQSPLLSQAQTDTVVASSLLISTQMVPVTIPPRHVTASVPDVLPTCSVPLSPLLSQATETIVASSVPSSTQMVPVTIPPSHVTASVPDVLPTSVPQSPLLSKAQRETIVASTLPSSTQMVPVAIPPSPVIASVPDVLPACPVPQPQVDHLDAKTTFACSKETSKKVADAKLQAEEASALATTAVNYCQDLWSQLAKQTTEMTQKDEVKIAAALGAASAAASVAKAAAAAARVASDAALQAKLMVDEALALGRTGDGAQSGSLVFNVHSMGGAVSNQSGSVLVAAREAAKRRLEAASAAAKQAENLDAIVKAAELAAEAVSQAGQIVVMGDPLPLKELINAGLEGYWKLSQTSSRFVIKSVNGIDEQITLGCAEGAVISAKEYCGPACVKGNEILDQEKVVPGEFSNGSSARNGCGISESVAVGDKEQVLGKSSEVSDTVQPNRGLPVLGNSSGHGSVEDEQEELGALQGNNIKEGSSVEVYKNGDGIKPAWFSASVSTLHDGKAFVQYTSLSSKEGSDNLKEWVPLEGDGGKAPKIRAVLPTTPLHWQGTRKRRRSAVRNHAWAVGDMVDVCIQDSWREGVVTEKNEKDEMTLTIHFPARGETSAVNSQQLRPLRIWSDGNWVEWSRSKGHDYNNESDTPLEKRSRLRSPLRIAEEKNKSLDDAKPAVGEPEESKVLALSASDKVFNAGKSTKAETKPNTRRTLKTALQKEGSRVVFGVPKPGKKRKYMEVSKHFRSDQNRKDNEAKEPVKFTKYDNPRGTASRGLKNLSKVDSKEGQALKVATISRKSRRASNRTAPRRDDIENAAPDCGSSLGTSEADEGPLSSLFANKLSTKSGLLNKRKLVASGEQLAKGDEEKAHNGETDDAQSEAGEPRRSNRRFRPTHKLLEGLQSSSIIPKMSSASQDKGQGVKNNSKS